MRRWPEPQMPSAVQAPAVPTSWAPWVPHLSLTALHDDELLLGRGAGKDNLRVVLQDLVDLLRGEVFEVSAVDHTGLGVPGRAERGQGRRGVGHQQLARTTARRERAPPDGEATGEKGRWGWVQSDSGTVNLQEQFRKEHGLGQRLGAMRGMDRAGQRGTKSEGMGRHPETRILCSPPSWELLSHLI